MTAFMADDKKPEEGLRDQAELIDRLLVQRLEGIDAKLKPIRADLAIIKHAVGVLLTRVT
jgi:hypothetical protein